MTRISTNFLGLTALALNTPRESASSGFYVEVMFMVFKRITFHDRYGADRYDDDPYNLVTLARQAALEQVRPHLAAPHLEPNGTTLDVACGTGAWLQQLRALAPMTCIGMDISEAMLAVARQKVAMQAIHADVRHLPTVLSRASVNLAASHFLFGFVEPRAVIRSIAEVLKPGGLYSAVTSTYQSFTTFQKFGRALIPAAKLRATVRVPQTADELRGWLVDEGFEVIASRTVTTSFSIATPQELSDFAFAAGWAGPCADLFPRAISLPWLIRSFAGVIQRLLPIHEQFEACAVLARKPANS